MEETFDNLFEDFMNNKPKKENKVLPDNIKQLIESLINFKEVNDEESVNELEDNLHAGLGEPDLSEISYKDGLKFNKLTWNTPYGQFIKIVVEETNSSDMGYEDVEFEDIINNLKQTKTLQEQLDEAVEEENYTLAIELRDKIKNLQK